MQFVLLLENFLAWLGDHLIVQLTFLALAGSSLMLVLDAAGFLPDAASRWFNRKRLIFSVELLRQMGVTIPEKDTIIYTTVDYQAAARQWVAQFTVRKPVTVGRVESAAFPEFVDVMGACTDPATATQIARILSTHARRRTVLFDGSGRAQFDAVACPKSGSPILAYEFAKIVNRPLILHPANPKFQDATADPRGRFDFNDIDFSTGRRCALLVDDSTTGGRLMLDLTADLRGRGWNVRDCLVLFEPKGKGARHRLKQNNIRLHAVVEGPKASG